MKPKLSSSHDFNKYQAEIIARNCHNFQRFTLGGAIITGIILLIGIIMTNFTLFLFEYFIFFIYLSLCYVIALKCVKTQTKHILLITYLALLPIYLISILMGTFLDPQRQAITILVLLCGLNIFIVDKPWRIMAYMISISIVFVICSYFAKDSSLFRVDFFNALIFLCVSLGINYVSALDRLESTKNYVQIREKSELDPLTNVYNRGTGEKIVCEYLDAKSKGAFIILDIDNFKRINDTYGHQTGDMVIISTAQALTKTFSEDAVVWRLGGDEFAVYAINLLTADACEDKLNALQTLLSEINTSTSENLNIQISAGCTINLGQIFDFEALYKHSDAALYTVKRKEKGHFQITNDHDTII